MSNLQNCLSIDVEGFIESNLESFPIAKKHLDKSRETYEIEQNIDRLVEFLAQMNVQATFFFVGRIARDIPRVVKQVAQAGHEIGCHGYEHNRVFGMSPNGFKEKLLAAKSWLEDRSGKRVYGFRAPDFSITRSSVWALDILKETGFVYDSSIYPIRVHDVYGIPGGKRFIHVLPNGLIEWPLATFEFLGARFPFGGGGYFRLYPLFITKFCISSLNRCSVPCMFYIHPYEVGPVIPIIPEMSAYRRFRHYHNCGGGGWRLKHLLEIFRFGPAIHILARMGHLQVEQHV